MSNNKAVNKFFIPLLKLKGVIKSDGTLNTDTSNPWIKSVKKNPKPTKPGFSINFAGTTPKWVKNKTTKKPETEISTVSKSNNKRKGISASILNQSNLLKTKSITKKKTLLGG